MKDPSHAPGSGWRGSHCRASKENPAPWQRQTPHGRSGPRVTQTGVFRGEQTPPTPPPAARGAAERDTNVRTCRRFPAAPPPPHGRPSLGATERPSPAPPVLRASAPTGETFACPRCPSSFPCRAGDPADPGLQQLIQGPLF